MPSAFCNSTRSYPNLYVVGVLIRHLTPEAYLSSNNLPLDIGSGYLLMEVLLVHSHPCVVHSVLHPQEVPNTEVQIIRSIVGDDNLVLS